MRVLLLGLMGLVGCEAVDAGDADIGRTSHTDGSVMADMAVGSADAGLDASAEADVGPASDSGQVDPDMAVGAMDEGVAQTDADLIADAARVDPDAGLDAMDQGGAADAAWPDAAIEGDFGSPDADAGSPDADAAPPEPDMAAPDAAPPEPDMAVPDAAPPEPCPPSPPFGNRVGQTAPNVTLPDCDGNNFALHDQCGQPVWVFQFAGWCPPCRTFASNMEAVAQSVRELGYQPVFVISDTANFSPPDAAYCSQIQAQYGLTMPVLFDRDGVFSAQMGVASNSVNVVVGADGEVLFKSQWDSAPQMQRVLEGLAE